MLQQNERVNIDTSNFLGLKQPLLFKKYNCKYTIFPIDNKNGNKDIIFKSKDKNDRIWKYIPYRNYNLSYDLNDNYKPVITLVKKGNFFEVRINKLNNKKLLVSTQGVIIDRKKCEILNHYTNPAGYEYINTRQHGTLAVHRLVAHAFCPRPEHLKDVPYDDLVVNHKDGIKGNNHYTNLEWCTHSENAQHAYDTGLNNYKGDIHHMVRHNTTDIPDIRKSFYESGKSLTNFSKDIGLSRAGLTKILMNKTRKDESYLPNVDYINKNGIVRGENHSQSKLKQSDVDWIRSDFLENKNPYKFYIDKFKVSNETIKLILRNRIWVDKNYTPPAPRTSKNTYEDATWIRQHKKDNPNTPFSFYMNKYGIANSTVSQILNNKVYKDNSLTF
jgi:hypothetical protein